MTEDKPTAGHSGHASPPSATAAAAQALSRLADLARTSLETQARLAKQSVDLTWATLAGDLDRNSANKAYVESVTREGARYWRTVGELGVEYATDLVALGKSVSTAVLREVAAAGRKPGVRHAPGATAGSAESPAHQVVHDGGSTQTTYSRTGDWTSSQASSQALDHDAAGRRVKVSLRGSIGQRAEGMITVANQHPRPRRIQLSAGDLVDSTGAALDAVLDLEPTTVSVPSGQERSVNLGVDLDKASFSAGERYSSTVKVSGGDEATIEVSVEVV